MSPLLSRILVAAVGLPALLGLVWLGGWWLWVLAVGGGLVALHELYAIARPLRPLVLAGYTGLVLALLGAQLGGMLWLAGGVIATLPLAFLLKGVSETRQSLTVAVGTTALGAAWIGFGLGCVLLLRAIPEHGRLVAFTLLLAVFAADTLAFFVGRLVGRHKLAPVISPGKTWEGLVASTLAAVLVTFFALYKTRHTFLSVGEAFVLGAAIAAAAPVGDLFESAVKRDFGVKDSGSVLLGHGGMLDRLDALLFASVASYYVLVALT